MQKQRWQCGSPQEHFQSVIRAPNLDTFTVAEYDRCFCPINSSELTEKIAHGRRQLNDKIAKLAYDRAVRRGFAPGHELEDWLAAEAELLRPAPRAATLTSDSR